MILLLIPAFPEKETNQVNPSNIKIGVRKKNTRQGLLSATVTNIIQEKKIAAILDKSSTKRDRKRIKTNSSKEIGKKIKKVTTTGFMTQRKPKARVYNLNELHKKSSSPIQTPQNPSKCSKNSDISEIIPFPSPMRPENSLLQKSQSNDSFTHNSPDFKINLTDHSILNSLQNSQKSKIQKPPSSPRQALPSPRHNNIVKDSNKSLIMDSLEEEKFHAPSSKDSNFIEIGDNEISAHDSFSREPETRVRQAPELTSSPQEEIDKSDFLRIEVEEKKNENVRLQVEKDELRKEVKQYEEMLTKMNQEYEKVLNDKIKDSLRVRIKYNM